MKYINFGICVVFLAITLAYVFSPHHIPMASSTTIPISAELDVREPSFLTKETINKALDGTKLYGLGEAFVTAERTYGVNANFLVSLAWLESGKGESRIYLIKNNAFGFGAFDASPFDSAYAFISPADGVLFVAQYLSREYLSPTGKWFNGGYTVDHIGERYSSDPNWANKVVQISRQLF